MAAVFAAVWMLLTLLIMSLFTEAGNEYDVLVLRLQGVDMCLASKELLGNFGAVFSRLSVLAKREALCFIVLATPVDSSSVINAGLTLLFAGLIFAMPALLLK